MTPQKSQKLTGQQGKQNLKTGKSVRVNNESSGC